LPLDCGTVVIVGRGGPQAGAFATALPVPTALLGRLPAGIEHTIAQRLFAVIRGANPVRVLFIHDKRAEGSLTRCAVGRNVVRSFWVLIPENQHALGNRGPGGWLASCGSPRANVSGREFPPG
jgi:hypothetical protein